MANTLNLGVLISGSGRTLKNFIDLIAGGDLPARIAIVISDRHDATGLAHAVAAKLPTAVVPRKGTPRDAFNQQITNAMLAARVDLVANAGFLSLWTFPESFTGRVMNIHPALLPDFGGKGFYGHHVHDAVLAAGRPESGCTVHFCDLQYDTGPIILQRKVPVLPNDTPDTLADRVFEQELLAYPETIRLYAQNRIHLTGQQVEITPDP